MVVEAAVPAQGKHLGVALDEKNQCCMDLGRRSLQQTKKLDFLRCTGRR